MRYFSTGDFADRVNFVDNNNVFVGYDFHGQCCEEFGWIITDVDHFDSVDEYENARSIKREDIEGWDEYHFDTNYCYVNENLYNSTDSSNIFAIVIFRMVCFGRDNLYLVFHNYQNGFYSHGFEMKDADENVLHDGYL